MTKHIKKALYINAANSIIGFRGLKRAEKEEKKLKDTETNSHKVFGPSKVANSSYNWLKQSTISFNLT